MCLSSFFQFPLFVITCVEKLEKTSPASSNPQDMVNGGTKTLPSLLLMLGCVLLVLGVMAPEASASPISSAAPHHHHTRPWAARHRTTHVRRTIFVPITTGAELPDIPSGADDEWSIDAHLPGFATKWVPISANTISSPLRHPRDILARTYECWKDGKLWPCVMRILMTGEEANSSP